MRKPFWTTYVQLDGVEVKTLSEGIAEKVIELVLLPFLLYS